MIDLGKSVLAKRMCTNGIEEAPIWIFDEKMLHLERTIHVGSIAKCHSILASRSKEMLVDLVKPCDSLDMTLGEFFSTQKFDELEQEIQ